MIKLGASKSVSHAGTPIDVEGVIGGVLLTLPFYKHIFAWMGAHPAGMCP